MTTYISILRGINVSGKNLIKMDALKKMYENLGFQNIKTYVQSGNVVFKATGSEKEIAQTIIDGIKSEFGYDVPVIVLNLDDFKDIIENSPFAKDPSKDPAFLHVTFLADKPGNFDRKAIDEKVGKGEEIHFADNAVYLYCPNGYGVTKLSNTFLESKLKVTATTRNWKSTNAIFNLAQ